VDLIAVTTDPVATGIVVGALVLILCGAAWQKFAEPNAFLAALAGYQIVPAAALSLASKVIPALEATLALGLLIPATRAWALYASALLLLAYGLGMAINLWRGRSYIDCGCGGSAQPLSWALVLRNSILAMAALAFSGPTADRVFAWLDAVTLLAGVLAFYVIYLLADELLRQASRMTRT
jgi:hypothetical protein